MSKHNQDDSLKAFADEFLPSAAKAAAIAGGVALVYELFKHRRLILTVGVLAGTAAAVNRMAVRGPAGRPGHPRSLRGQDVGSPSFRGDDVRTSSQQPMDELDEAMMESFPASDPPASYRRQPTA